VPVLLASWFTSRRAGLALAFLLPMARLVYGILAWDDGFP